MILFVHDSVIVEDGSDFVRDLGRWEIEPKRFHLAEKLVWRRKELFFESGGQFSAVTTAGRQGTP
jgi:hypothetical protein